MRHIREKVRDVPVICEADVAVIGGSCTGVFAAVRAARLGMRVAIVEKQNCFGGTATAGAVNVWHSLMDTGGSRQIIAGLTQEVIDRLRKRNAVMEGQGPASAYRLNTEELKIELDELVVENGITPFLHTLYVAPVVEENELKAVIVENKNGRLAIAARRFVDATGDGELALHLNLPAHEEETFQPPTTCAKISGMPRNDDFDWQSAVNEHGSEFGLGPDWGWSSTIPDAPGVTMRADHHVFGLDTSDAAQLTLAEIEGRRRVRGVMDVIRRYGPCDLRPVLLDLAAAIGVRETRRIRAQYRLSGDDVLHGRRFDDAIANGSYPVDIHHRDGAGITFRYLDGTERVVPMRGSKPKLGRWREPTTENPGFYQIPLRSLLPERITNLVLSGRMLDADQTAFGAVRVMVNLNQTGEAVGTACALSCQSDCTIAEVPCDILRETLAAGGSIVL